MSRLHRKPRVRSGRGFTLVELMVALTGGLFVSLAVFALARDAGRFYQQESRLANATVGALVGFERLRTDIARAGFMSSPNVVRDPFVCSKPTSAWPTAMQGLSSIQITQPASTSNASLSSNGRIPQSILLAGSFASPDIFPGQLAVNGTTVSFQLQVDSPAMARLIYSPTQAASTLSAVFGVGRMLRVMQFGKAYFGQIASVTGGPQPSITLASSPAIQFRSGSALGCGAEIINTSVANVVNFVQYDVRNLATNAQTALGTSDNAALYTASSAAPYEANRTELVRVELNAAGTPINGTEELVAEYAVDLQTSLVAGAPLLSATGPTVSYIGSTNALFSSYAGSAIGGANQPELIHSVRVRLGVRAREGDRDGTITGNGATSGIYRFGLGASGAGPYARVRTFQADVALYNQASVTW